jgi:hypothetical protein
MMADKIEAAQEAGRLRRVVFSTRLNEDGEPQPTQVEVLE